jgi:hypothetical protein
MIAIKTLPSLSVLLILMVHLIAAAPIEAPDPSGFDPTAGGNPRIEPQPFEILARKRGDRPPPGTGSGGIYNKDWPYGRIADIKSSE